MARAGAAAPRGPTSPYDEVPYLGHPFAQTHPDRLATLATLFGLEPPAVATARVLELGCGDAGNLAPMAIALPGATFAGIDSAPGAIARGRALAGALGLGNLTLETASIEELDVAAGGFDYVIAHGVYSWLQPPARDALLAVCSRALAPDGVAYVSYNAQPGGRLRQALRDMLLFHVSEAATPDERLAQARAFLAFLVETWPEGEDFGGAMRRQAERLLEREDAILFHDDLAPVNEPVYFHELVAHAATHGLQYLAEADFFEMQTAVPGEAAGVALAAVDDVVRREQYLDFLKGRAFRQTLLCRAEVTVDRSPRPGVVARLAASSPAARAGGPDEAGRVTFEGPTGSRLTTDHPGVIAALERVAASWPAAVWVRDLLGGDPEAVCDALLRGYAANLLQLHACPPRLAAAASERPVAGALARHQAATGDLVTNLRHAIVRLEDDLARRLVVLLDGSRDRAALAADVGAHLAAAGRAVPDDLGERLERALASLARLALLRA